MKSIGNQIKQLEALLDTGNLSDRENGFVGDMVAKPHSGMATGDLSERQVEVIERLYEKHFADSEKEL